MGTSDVEPWTTAVKVSCTVVHAVAILVTIFRLLYRKYLSRFGWEDGWAALALICDMACLASVWMQEDPDFPNAAELKLDGNWLLSLSITSVVWFARMSILCSAIRIPNTTLKLRRIAYCVGAMFLFMEAGLLAQKIIICVINSCYFTTAVAIAQLVTDVVSDLILVGLPVWFLRGMHLPQDHRILILSTFSASILITCVTILHSALLFQDSTSITLIIGHVKAALALFVCNLLVLVTLVYRLCHTPTDITDTGVRSSTVEFTSVIDLATKLSSYGYPILGADAT